MLTRIPELVISFLAVAKAQGIAAPINFELADEKIKTLISNMSPDLVVVHEDFLDLAKRSLPSGSGIPLISVGDSGKGEDISWAEILQNRNSEPPSLKAGADDIVYLNYTSGSTGNSKGALTTNSNIYWNTISSIDALKLTPEDIHLCMFAPFAHPHEIFARPLYLGGTMVLIDTIYPKSIAEAISGHRVTCMMGLAPLYENVLNLLEHRTYDLSSLRIPESGGMYTRPELIEKFKRKLGIPIIPVWGSTETTGIAIANRPGEAVPTGSVGKPCSSYRVMIVDENHRELPDGEIGEMIFSGPAVIKGYHEYTTDGQMCFRNEWYCSGDLGKKDKEGNFYFVERKTGMMKVAGLKVYPLEIELALLEHPDIKEAAVISVKDRLRGEVPKAIIVTKNGNKLSEKDIQSFCKERLSHYKLPRVVEFRESLPKIGSGKINKKVLQAEHQ
jgi:acyl-coenzyme A synthetase/AMP-(fatty) acid ligase